MKNMIHHRCRRGRLSGLMTGGPAARTALAGLAALILPHGSCLLLRPASAPMRVVRFAPAAAHAPTLVVLLPGRASDPADFGTERFPALAKEAGLAVDMIAVDAHLGHYLKRTLNVRLKVDIIDPARAAGYKDIWLVGISMGGLGALLYAREHPDDVNGLVLLAPFLGDRAVIDEIGAAGRLSMWKPQEPLPASDYQRMIWLFLKDALRPGAAGPDIWLGFGTEDAFARANGLLGRELPPERVFTAPGGHRWETWRGLWRRMLERGMLPTLGELRKVPAADTDKAPRRRSNA